MVEDFQGEGSDTLKHTQIQVQANWLPHYFLREKGTWHSQIIGNTWEKSKLCPIVVKIQEKF